MYCIKCGKKLNDTAKFCAICGTRVHRLSVMPSNEEPQIAEPSLATELIDPADEKTDGCMQKISCCDETVLLTEEETTGLMCSEQPVIEKGVEEEQCIPPPPIGADISTAQAKSRRWGWLRAKKKH